MSYRKRQKIIKAAPAKVSREREMYLDTDLDKDRRDGFFIGDLLHNTVKILKMFSSIIATTAQV